MRSSQGVRLILNLSFGWHFKENAAIRNVSMQQLSFLFTSQRLYQCVNRLVDSDSHGWQNLQGPSRISFIKKCAYQPSLPHPILWGMSSKITFIQTYDSTSPPRFTADALLAQDSLEAVVSLRRLWNNSRGSTVRRDLLWARALLPELKVQSWIKNIKSGRTHQIENAAERRGSEESSAIASTFPAYEVMVMMHR